MKIFLIVLGCVAALIFLILISKISLRVSFDEKLSVTAGFWFIRVDILKLVSKKRDAKPSEEKKKRKKKKPVQTEETAEKKKRSVGELLDFLGFITSLLKELFSKLFDKLFIDIRKLEITVATDDPCRTALLYGAAAPAVYQLTEAAKRFLRCRADYKNIGVRSDFCSAVPKAAVDAVFSLRIAAILSLGLTAVGYLVKMKNETKRRTRHERYPVEAGH